MFPGENRWDGNDGAPLSVSVMGFIRISQHIAHELEISVYYLQFTLFRLSLHLSGAIGGESVSQCVSSAQSGALIFEPGNLSQSQCTNF